MSQIVMMTNLFMWDINPMLTFSIRDILDIAIITFAIYRLTLWIKETKAVTLFKGILMLLVITGLSFALQMRAVWWVVSNFANIGIIALVVLFQPEIRKMLEEMGRGTISTRLVAEEAEGVEEFISEFIYVLKRLASRKVGALIILEQVTPLADIEHSGVKVDAIFTRNLVLNIFEPNAPLHDGAVIIRRRRIAAASCILPLTDKEIDKDLGTRHRAALGLSESSDAIAFVVSEETGKISVAKNGKLQIGLTEDKVAKILATNIRYGNKKRLVLWRS